MQNIFEDFEHPTLKGVIHGNSKIKIYGNLWLIDGHF